jgi:hypothetical protein
VNTFAAQMQQTGVALEQWAHAVHERVADLALDSIANGSATTGAPGQPVAAALYEHSGALRDSWRKSRAEADVIVLSTDIAYAPPVEDNLRGMRFTNHGPHSIKLTVLGSPALIRQAMQDVAGGAA